MSIKSSRKEKIRDKLLIYGKSVEGQYIKESKINSARITFTPNEEANTFVCQNFLAFLFGVILDQGMKAEKVWAIPFLLKKRLGHLDVNKITKMNDGEIKKIFKRKPMLHRFPEVMALRIKSACNLIINKYNEKVENIWNDKPKSDDLQRRFEQFNGIGQKKASMATNILVKDFGIEVKDKKGIDVSYDIHIRRVFLRTGLVEKDDRNLIIQAARELNPEYPGALDLPCWQIGRNWCHPRNPDCKNCYLNKYCPKII